MKRIKNFSLLLIVILLITGCSKDNTTNDLTYNVSFDSNGGTSINTQIVKKGEKVEKPNEPTKNGYKFKEWTLENETYDFDKPVEKSFELKATWEKENDNIKYVVTFDSTGGSLVESQTVENGKQAIKPNVPTRNGYKFVEWQLNGKTYDFNNTIINNITLKAVWSKNEQKKYTVKFDSNGGSSIKSQTIESGKK